ncbi:alpha/beta hydrolase [Streptomyces chumphonensis]|uniref:alpha/beta hydrolase n=1 Tax=Streptomyces chumphonensis TaxID=1214925 RepID=UPI003D762384
MDVHRRTMWRRAPDGSGYRVRRSFPSRPPTATVLLAGPSAVTALDGDGTDARLLTRLTDGLVAAGAQVLACDMPAREPGRLVDEGDERARVERLEGLLRAHRHVATGPVSLVGFSVSGLAVLRLLETGRVPHVDRVLLVGTMLDEEAFIDTRVDSVDLVYGSLDLVGYLTDGEGERPGSLPPAVLGPEMYGEWSARRVVGRHPLTVRVQLLEGLGHTLQPLVPGPVRDPVAALTEWTVRPSG